MSRRDQPGGLLDGVREVLGGDDAPSAGGTFMRGLTLGALIGAAVAGSALWQRRARTSKRKDAAALPSGTGEASERPPTGS